MTHHMSPAELKTLRESMGLSQQWLADRAGVRLRSVQYSEDGRSAVKEDVAALVLDMDARLDALIHIMMEIIRRRALAGHGKPETVALIRYRDDADLWRFRPEMHGFPASYHAAMVSRLRRALWAEGIASVIEYMDPEAYAAWLDGRADSEAMRGAWAAVQAGIVAE